MDSDRIKITIVGGKVNFEDEINLMQVGQIMAFLGSQEQHQNNPQSFVVPASNASSTSLVSGQTRLSIREYLDECEAKTYPQLILALGKYYLLFRASGATQFTSKEIQVLIKEAKELPPSNLSRDFQTAISFGWIAEEGKGNYWITNIGDEALQSKFAIRPKKPSSKKAKATSSKKSGKPAKTPGIKLEMVTGIDSQALRTFVSSYGKCTSPEYNLLFVYFLEKKTSVAPITVNHVYTCYHLCDLRPPNLLHQSIRDTKSKKVWIAFDSIDDLKTTPKGDNYVLHDKKAKSTGSR